MTMAGDGLGIDRSMTLLCGYRTDAWLRSESCSASNLLVHVRRAARWQGVNAEVRGAAQANGRASTRPQGIRSRAEEVGQEGRSSGHGQRTHRLYEEHERRSVPSRHGHPRGRDRVACGHAPRESWLWSLTSRAVLDRATGRINQACSGDASREDDVQRDRDAARLYISAVLMRGSGGAEGRPRPAGACQIRLESSRQVQRAPVCLSHDERALRCVRRALAPERQDATYAKGCP
jgi:hypothetical protein